MHILTKWSRYPGLLIPMTRRVIRTVMTESVIPNSLCIILIVIVVYRRYIAILCSDSNKSYLATDSLK